MDTVCRQLDSLVEEYFSTLDEVFQQQQQLENLLKGGFLQMAKARYSMGSKSVGQLQYEQNEHEPSVKIKTDDNNTGVEFQICNDDGGEEKSSPDKNLRHRKAKSKSALDGDVDSAAASVTDAEDKDDDAKDGGQSKKHKDPIRMFGVLVPAALRQSQDQFKRSFEVVTSLCSLKSKLLHIKRKYHELDAQKKKLSEQEAPDDKTQSPDSPEQ